MGIAALERLDKLLGGQGLGDDDLEHVFGEPLVGHHKPTLFPRSLAPRILDLVPDGFAGLRVNVHATDNHRVCHGRFINLEALLFGHAKFDVESGLCDRHQDISR